MTKPYILNAIFSVSVTCIFIWIWTGYAPLLYVSLTISLGNAVYILRDSFYTKIVADQKLALFNLADEFPNISSLDFLQEVANMSFEEHRKIIKKGGRVAIYKKMHVPK